jgi:predicted HTH domain antitoxin
MHIITVKVDVPKDILLAADISEENASSDIRKHLAVHLFKERILSFGKATELSGMDKYYFLELIGKMGISLNYGEGEYQEDLKTLMKIEI